MVAPCWRRVRCPQAPRAPSPHLSPSISPPSSRHLPTISPPSPLHLPTISPPSPPSPHPHLRTISPPPSPHQVLASNTSTGTLECRTQPAADPLAAEGLLCAVLVEVLDEQSGTALATAELVDGFQMRSQASSPLITAASASSGSTEGGLLLCLHGERLALTLNLTLTLTFTLTLTLTLTLNLALIRNLTLTLTLTLTLNFILIPPLIPRPTPTRTPARTRRAPQQHSDAARARPRQRRVPAAERQRHQRVLPHRGAPRRSGQPIAPRGGGRLRTALPRPALHVRCPAAAAERLPHRGPRGQPAHDRR